MSTTNIMNQAETLDSELLRTFLAVADTGSVTAGAERIFRSQSAASLQVKRLETLLGQPVFERHGRGVALTPAGERLRPVALQVVGLLDGALSDLRANPVQGRLRIGIPDEYGPDVLAQVVAAFGRDHPRVELSVQCALSASFPRAIEQGLLDMAVYDVDAADPAWPVLRRQRICWATTRRHAVHLRNPLPLALFDRDCWWRNLALDTLQATGRPHRIVYTSESAAGVLAAIKAGIAVGLCYEEALDGDLMALDETDGFPTVKDSALIVACREGLDTAIADSMRDLLRSVLNAKK